jgi:hypothetical protein
MTIGMRVVAFAAAYAAGGSNATMISTFRATSLAASAGKRSNR